MRTPIHPHSLSGTYSMTEPFTERFHRRVNWPPGSWHPPELLSSNYLYTDTK
jgi:hypothetical protein